MRIKLVSSKDALSLSLPRKRGKAGGGRPRPRPIARAAGREHATIARRGLMLVLSSPSGAGKTTLSRMLLEIDPMVDLSISVTTRKQRPGEIAGMHYHFVDDVRFDQMVRDAELL